MTCVLPNPFEDSPNAAPVVKASQNYAEGDPQATADYAGAATPFHLDERTFWSEIQTMSDWMAQQILSEEAQLSGH